MSRPRAAQPATSSSHASDRARRRRLAVARKARASKVLICESPAGDAPRLREAIDALGYDTVHCPTLDDCLRVAPQSSPAAVLVELPDDSENAVSLLQLLRRTLPSTPLVIVAPNASLETRARIHPLRPYYFAVPPVPSDELRAVIQGAVTSQAHRA